VPVSLDLNLRLELGGGGWRPGQGPAYEGGVGGQMSCSAPGQEEIVPLAGASSIEAAARGAGRGQRTLIARLGDRRRVRRVRARGACAGFEVAVVDTLGAGDAFNGAISRAAAGMGRWTRCAGNAVAALSITRSGPRGTPRRAEVEGILARWGLGRLSAAQPGTRERPACHGRGGANSARFVVERRAATAPRGPRAGVRTCITRPRA